MNGGVGILFLTAGIWWIYCGFNGYRPVALLMAIVKSPDDASELIAAVKDESETSGYVSAGTAGGEAGGIGSAVPSIGNSTGSPDVSGSGLSGPQSFALSQMSKYGWDKGEFDALVTLWTKESGWNYQAKNPSSGAYGIPQALPASKMASAGADYMTNANTQIKWGLGYIKGRYGSPSKALAFHLKHNWY